MNLMTAIAEDGGVNVGAFDDEAGAATFLFAVATAGFAAATSVTTGVCDNPFAVFVTDYDTGMAWAVADTEDRPNLRLGASGDAFLGGEIIDDFVAVANWSVVDFGVGEFVDEENGEGDAIGTATTWGAIRPEGTAHSITATIAFVGAVIHGER